MAWMAASVCESLSSIAMPDVKYLVVERGATVDERVVAEFEWLDEAVLYAVIQYSEYERRRSGVMVYRDEDGRRSHEF
ncbi:hypothetical protein KXR53_15485 [Inquilinus limosus]|uniref:hypothetical protein n=1 Tax=Inquilinus limosus TaxID=171674 RepID=UPI003F135CF0